MFEFSAEHSLALHKNKQYNDIAYDGEHIYICGDDRQIIVLDRACNPVRQFTSEHTYYTFCYDESRLCFWAASAESPGVLFQLSGELTVIKQIPLENLTVEYLFYNSSVKCLMAAEKGRLYTVSPSGEYEMAVEINGLERHSQKCCMIYDNLLCLSIQKRGPHLSCFSSETGNILMDTAVFTRSYIKSMVAIPTPSESSACTILLLGIRQNDAPHIIEINGTLDLGQRRMTAPFSRAFFEQPDQISQNTSDFGCGNPGNPDFGPSCHDPYDPVPLTMERCQNCGWDCCCQQCYYQSRANIMESIALTEASIAHILNAEGEKLQKAIASTSSVSELLQINESIVKTIIHSTHLEQALFNKLEAVMRGDCDCDCLPCQAPCCAQALVPEIPKDKADKTE